MAESRLTVRTLCLATVAFILACGHAARATAQQRPPDRASAKPDSVIRVVPAGSGKSAIATHRPSKAAGSRSGGGGSRVATFTNTSSSGTGAAVSTFKGERELRAGPTAASRKPQRTASSKPGGILRERKEPPVISVRRPGSHAEQPATEPMTIAFIAPDAGPTPRRQTIRNAFGGIQPASTVAEPTRVFAQAR